MKNFHCDLSTIVKTDAGKLQGYFYDGSYIFKGIHYAEAERFQQPSKVAPWKGIKDATSFGMVCPLMHQEVPNGELMVPHEYWPQDEHCQNLNIWTQTLKENAGKPVIVWLHGGGFSAGSAIEQLAYDGANMSKYGDCVVVTVNHRLNILGYLDLEPFSCKYRNSANAGNADLVAALQWIHDNISEFGGDPENVTLIGQSGGGMKVSSLMQTPVANGFFHKGIILSGVADRDMANPGEGDGTELITGILSELGLTTADVEKLETIPYGDLVKAYEKVAPELQKAGRYVGQCVKKNGFYHGELQFDEITEHAKTIPLIVGSAIAEFAFPLQEYDKRHMPEDEMDARLRKTFHEDTAKIKGIFKKAYPEKNPMDLLVYDHMVRSWVKDFVDARVKYKCASTYSYVFAYEFPVENGKLAWHCSDIPFVFHNIDFVPSANVPGVSDKLQEQIFASVINFANTGNPNNEEIPAWVPCKEKDYATMIFDRTCRFECNFDDELIEIHKKWIPINSLKEFNFEKGQH